MNKLKLLPIDWNAISSIILTATAVILLITAYAIFSQARYTKDILEQNKSSSYIENRAYIELNYMTINSQNDKWSISYMLRNNGETPAWEMGSIISCATTSIIPKPAEFKKYLPPQASYIDFVEMNKKCDEKFKIIIYYTDYNNISHQQVLEFFIRDENNKYIPDITAHYEQ